MWAAHNRYLGNFLKKKKKEEKKAQIHWQPYMVSELHPIAAFGPSSDTVPTLDCQGRQIHSVIMSVPDQWSSQFSWT